MLQKKGKLNDREVLDRILALLERDDRSTSPQFKIYNNKEVMQLLSIKHELLRKLRDNGYLSYSRHGDKYWYTQEDIDKFLKRFHHTDFSQAQRLPYSM